MTFVRPFLPFLLAVALAAAAAPGLSALQGSLHAMQARHGLTETAPLENAPPAVAFTTVALGGFRGLAADVLWLRSSQLQDEGQYFEMFQLASWIVKLQPRFTGATAYLAWNMAYNISVTFNTDEDRWRWVQRGLSLLRDEGLVYNPGDPLLYKELAWMYYNKIGQELDDSHRYYKSQLARQISTILGDPPVSWETLAAAPATPDALRAALAPDAALWGRLAAAKLGLDALEREFRRGGGVLPESLREPALPAAELGVLLPYLRRHWLQEECRLDAAYILRLNQKYGPLDWRLPQAHAIYWASRGVDAAPGNKSLDCDRCIHQSLAAAFLGGRAIYLRDVGVMEITPNIGLLPAANQTYIDEIAKYPGNSSITTGHRYFLIDAVVTLYAFGDRKTAAQYLKLARDRYAAEDRQLRRPLDEFVLLVLGNDMKEARYEQAVGTIQGYLRNSCRALAFGDGDRAAGFETIASKLWVYYQETIQPSAQKRRTLPPLATIKQNAVREAIESFPPGVADRLRTALGAPATEKTARAPE